MTRLLSFLMLIGAAQLCVAQDGRPAPAPVRRAAAPRFVRPITPMRSLNGRPMSDFQQRQWQAHAARFNNPAFRNGVMQNRVYTPGVRTSTHAEYNAAAAANAANTSAVRNARQNWRGNFNTANWRAANERWERARHDREWWRSHYDRFAVFGGGYYYWNAGWWYPAYGYDPYFSDYTYNAPLYAYQDEDPGQVIMNVQRGLETQGYYQGPIDGEYGPMTRDALLQFQRDNGLPESGQIDDATLGALGMQ